MKGFKFQFFVRHGFIVFDRIHQRPLQSNDGTTQLLTGRLRMESLPRAGMGGKGICGYEVGDPSTRQANQKKEV